MGFNSGFKGLKAAELSVTAWKLLCVLVFATIFVCNIFHYQIWRVKTNEELDKLIKHKKYN